MLRRALVLATVVFSFVGFLPAAFAETKIGSVNISTLMQEAPQARIATDNLKASFSEREKAILSVREEIRGLEDSDTSELSRAETETLELKIRERKRELQRDSDVFTEDFSLARNEALKSIQEDVYKAIVDVAERDQYDLVLSESVLYASDRVDITDLVLERLKTLSAQ